MTTSIRIVVTRICFGTVITGSRFVSDAITVRLLLMMEGLVMIEWFKFAYLQVLMEIYLFRHGYNYGGPVPRVSKPVNDKEFNNEEFLEALRDKYSIGGDGARHDPSSCYGTPAGNRLMVKGVREFIRPCNNLQRFNYPLPANWTDKDPVMGTKLEQMIAIELTEIISAYHRDTGRAVSSVTVDMVDTTAIGDDRVTMALGKVTVELAEPGDRCINGGDTNGV